jgi:coenzyme F420 hydrogenase subunit beta
MAAQSPTLEKALRGKLCSGCGLCAGISGGAISMTIDAAGYARPMQHVELVEAVEYSIAHACPAFQVSKWPVSADSYWGPQRQVMTGHATDPAIRRGASSGGAITGLLAHALRSGQIDAVVQITADPFYPFYNIVVVSRTEAQISEAMGSRYAPSSPLSGLGALLESRERYAFVGKPCDVSALRQLGKNDDRVAQRFPLMLSFFCAGIPSLKGTDRILDDLGVRKDDLAAFRYRGDGWPGFATATRKDGSVARMSYEESWGNRLSHHVQFRCKICPDAVGGAADIACADAWYGGETGYPQFEEADGRSLIIARNAAGEALLADAIAAGAIAGEPLPLAEIVKMQPSQARRKRLIASRLAALVVTFRPRPRFAGVAIQAAAKRASVLESLRSFLGLVRRVIQGRI